jgi:hypothetical protein
MAQAPFFSIEEIDGCRLGRLCVPLSDVADWLNFLATPGYRASLVAAEQDADHVDLYFQGNGGLYLYLEKRLGTMALLIAS